ncbi:MAG TPA: nuclear transport factor 2 family protein [Pseudonocardiaceae bacterium]|jgi:ketosteroid isomerase-like protein|nr:nuclear transport factor 2 family protein [Pseudonocardiaceae bacterium]
MSEAPSPAEVFDRLLTAITAREFADIPALYAEDVVVEQPFATPPMRIAGRESLRAHFSAVPPITMSAHDVMIHRTADPEVIVAEWAYDIVATGTDRTVSTRNVIVMRVRDGQIVESRDYHDHRAIAAVLTP